MHDAQLQLCKLLLHQLLTPVTVTAAGSVASRVAAVAPVAAKAAVSAGHGSSGNAGGALEAAALAAEIAAAERCCGCTVADWSCCSSCICCCKSAAGKAAAFALAVTVLLTGLASKCGLASLRLLLPALPSDACSSMPVIARSSPASQQRMTAMREQHNGLE